MFGVLAFPAVYDAGEVVFQEVDVIANLDVLVTVRKTPPQHTVVASVLLLPTFIVGLYGQNFRHIPELGWVQGYAFSWGLIVVTTALQLWYFRRKLWI